MKKYVPYIIIVILVALIAVGGTYAFMSGTYAFMKGQMDNQNKEIDDNANENSSESKDNDANSKPSSSTKSGIELVSTKAEGSNTVQTFNAYMNGKTVPVTIKYQYYVNEKLPVQFSDETEGTFVQGKMNDTEVYFRDTHGDKSLSKDTLLSAPQIEKSFNVNNFRVIKGSDNKDYLLVVTHMYEDRDDFDLSRSDIMYVFNDSLKKIEAGLPMNDCEVNNDAFMVVDRTSGVQVPENPWYKNEFNLDKVTVNNEGWDSVRVKVDNNQIYYLYAKLNDDSFGTLEERVYTISNDKLTYKTINTYKITNGAGGAC